MRAVSSDHPTLPASECGACLTEIAGSSTVIPGQGNRIRDGQRVADLDLGGGGGNRGVGVGWFAFHAFGGQQFGDLGSGDGLLTIHLTDATCWPLRMRPLARCGSA